MCTELPFISSDINEHLRFLYCGQGFISACEYCGTVHRYDEWHGCEASHTAALNRDEGRYQAYRQKLGTADSWRGD
jgi:hypothetical protein